MKDAISGGSELKRLATEIGAELDRVESVMDPAGFVDPELQAYDTRLHSLGDAVAAMEAYEEDLDQG